MVDPWMYFIVEEIIFPEESGGITGEGSLEQESQGLEVEAVSLPKVRATSSVIKR